MSLEEVVVHHADLKMNGALNNVTEKPDKPPCSTSNNCDNITIVVKEDVQEKDSGVIEQNNTQANKVPCRGLSPTKVRKLLETQKEILQLQERDKKVPSPPSSEEPNDISYYAKGSLLVYSIILTITGAIFLIEWLNNHRDVS